MVKWSAHVLTYNEEMWIPYQLKQLDGNVDEIIIVDGAFAPHKTMIVDGKEKSIFEVESGREELNRYGISDKMEPSSDKTREIIEQFKKTSKSKIILLNSIGTQIDNRNLCLKMSSYDNCFIIDADEFYPNLAIDLKKFDDLLKIFDYIAVENVYEFYFDFEHYILNKNIFAATRKDKKFIASRMIDFKKSMVYKGDCYHYSYVKPYNRIKEKMKSFGERGNIWLKNVVNNFGKISDEKLYEKNKNCLGSIHLMMKRMRFKENKIKHMDLLDPLIKEWRWDG